MMFRSLMICLFLVLSAASAYAVDGATVFKQKCAACHKIGKGRFVGPDLIDMHLRRDSTWLVNFIRSSQSLIKAGDTAAIKVFNEFHKVVMPDQNLTDEEMDALFVYIKSFSSPKGTARQPEERQPSTAAAPPKPAAEPEITLSDEERRKGLVIFFNRGAIFSLLGIAILFGILNFLLFLKFR